MRPLKLTMKAFGPYAGTQVLDFGHLQNRTFFLIHGPTGSGKTTILDAMCFALYGDTSGAERDGRQMRSHHADISAATEVIFDFVLGNDTYRIRRCPEQERPKSRGEGITTLKADATLWKRTGLPGDGEGGVVLQTGWSKVTEAIEKLLGFKSSQFRQVVMLPQGEFRKLLTADSKDRQVILETLFKTEYFRRVEEALKDSAKKLRESIEKVSAQRTWVLQEARAETEEDLKERYKTNKEQFMAIAKAVEESRQTVKKAREKLAAGQQTQEKLKEKRDAETALVEQAARMAEIDVKRSAVAKGRQAAALLDAETSMLSRRKEADDALRYLEAKKKQAATAVKIKEKADQHLDRVKEREPEREAARIKLAKLEELTGKVTDLTLAAKEAASQAQKVKLAEISQTKAKENLTSIQNYIAQRSTDRDKALEHAAQAAKLEAELKEAEQTFKKRGNLELAWKELKGIRQQLALAQEKLKAAENDYHQVREEHALLQDAWYKGQAAILAKKLSAGFPCPVCGSLDHPSPALSEARLPSEEDLKAKEMVVKELETAREEARKKAVEITAIAAAWQSKAEDLEQELGEKATSSLEELQKTLQESQRRWKAASQALTDYPALNAELEELREKEKSAKEQVEACISVLQTALAGLEAARATVKERELQVPENLRDPAALLQAQQKARTERDRLVAEFEQARMAAEEAAHGLAKAESAVAEANEAYELANKRALKEEQAFQERLIAAGFPRQEDYQAAKRSPQDLQLLESLIREYDENLKAARDRLDRAAQRAQGLTEPDIEQLAGALAEAETVLDNLVSRGAELQAKTKQEEEWLKKLGELSQQLQDLEGNYAVLGHVSDVANGKNQYGITFQRFVLGALLDDVCIAATERLKLMSRGRYHLQRTMDRARKNSAGGLELEVFDAYTGLARPVTTLSGGETFLASLSLALGLADVVQAYSGGIYLDTIFVDEGFGTLDPESLDFAIKTLIDLQKDGRLVGIISHVPELKERIDARLEVRPTDRGSAAGFVLS
ncbi:MAG: AAA family ATPase [Bacillota bacterium]